MPIEIRVAGDKEPVYEDSLEDLGRFNEQPVLPFNAYGTLAVARAEFDNNSGSSQVGGAVHSGCGDVMIALAVQVVMHSFVPLRCGLAWCGAGLSVGAGVLCYVLHLPWRHHSSYQVLNRQH